MSAIQPSQAGIRLEGHAGVQTSAMIFNKEDKEETLVHYGDESLSSTNPFKSLKIPKNAPIDRVSQSTATTTAENIAETHILRALPTPLVTPSTSRDHETVPTPVIAQPGSVISRNQIQTRPHLSDHRDVESKLPETDTPDFPASSTDVEHSYYPHGTAADLPTPTAITSPFLTTSTHEPHVLITPRGGPSTSTTPFEESSSLAHVYRRAPNLPAVSAIELQTSSNAPEAAIPAAGPRTIDSDCGETLHESRRSSIAPESAVLAAGAQIIEPGFGETLHSSRHSSSSTHGQPAPTYPDAPNTSSTHNVLSGGVLTSRWSTNQAIPIKQKTKTRSEYPAFATNRRSRRGGVHHLPAWLQESTLPQSADPGAAARAQYRERENLDPNRPHIERRGLPEAKKDLDE